MTTSGDVSKERIRKVLESQKRPTVTILSSLLAAHDEFGYLPDEAIDEVAEYTDASINDVWGVATFYTNFRFSPPAKHVVEVCWGPTCHLAGATGIVESVLDAAGLKEEGDTEDKSVTIKYNTCLGACSQAPVVSVDHHLRGHVTPDKAVELIRPLSGGAE